MSWVGVITNSGAVLLDQWVSGATLTIAEAAAGTGSVSEVSMMAQTALANRKQTASIVSRTQTEDGCKIKLRITAPETGYTLQQFGVWAKLNSGTQALLALFQNAEGVVVPSAEEMPDFEYTFYALLGISNTGELTVVVDTSALVSQADMHAALDQALAVYATCATAASTARKIADCAGFTLKTGAHVSVRFVSGNSASTPYLNVNDTGDILIKRIGTTSAGSYMWQAGEVVDFVYDGTYWLMVKGGLATTTYYGLVKLSSAVNSTSTVLAATPSAVKQAYDLANSKQDALTFDAAPTANSANPVTSGGVFDALSATPNPNLLDNAYFIDPVNQLGRTSYTASGTHTIDRWVGWNCTVALGGDGITVTSAGTSGAQFVQTNELAAIPPGTYTLSLLVDELTGSGNMGYMTGTQPLTAGLNTVTFAIPDTLEHRTLYLLNYLSGTVKIRAAKLERGNRQSLARQNSQGNWVLNEIPEKALELIKCQRYYERGIRIIHALPPGATVYDDTIPFKVTKRATPTCTVVSASGSEGYISYFTGSAWAPVLADSATAMGTYGCRVYVGGLRAGTTVQYEIIADANL